MALLKECRHQTERSNIRGNLGSLIAVYSKRVKSPTGWCRMESDDPSFCGILLALVPWCRGESLKWLRPEFCWLMIAWSSLVSWYTGMH